MEITYLGYASFKLHSRGHTATLVTDPFNPQIVGIKFPKIEADIVTVSHQHENHNFINGVGGMPVVVSGPGEYEIKGVKIIGISCFHDKSQGKDRGTNTIYRINMDGVNLVHTGDLGHKLDEKTQEILDDVDVLMLSVGEEGSISISEAAETISQLEPKILIPMHYLRPDLNQSVFSKLSKLDVFLKEVGKTGIKPLPKLVVTKDKLPEEPMIVVLE